jgi:hypothetical protein
MAHLRFRPRLTGGDAAAAPRLGWSPDDRRLSMEKT